jgi:predicted CoA-binding protein
VPVETDPELREILEQARTIAVLGLKAAPEEDAHRVALYLQQHGYRIVPVNPKLKEALHEPAYASLAQLSVPTDLIDVFRASQHLPGHVDEILAMHPRPSVVWFQLGIRSDACARRLEAAGIRVVQDRCIMVEHRRLLAGQSGGAASPP